MKKMKKMKKMKNNVTIVPTPNVTLLNADGMLMVGKGGGKSVLQAGSPPCSQAPYLTAVRYTAYVVEAQQMGKSKGTADGVD